ncbi:ammonium transporter, partial [Polaromonas sp.]|uniref:ammonium transporter n=1 Tax=Polaromonas sp. TaxID=1869339 RepID=UPI0027318CA7
WMLMATILVVLMTIPGLALFYGGLVRAKNTLSVLMQVYIVFSMSCVLWAIYGYSIAFTGGGSFFGSFDKLFLSGVNIDSVGATFSKGVVIPEFVFIAFQATFCAITPALIVGAFAERIKFSAVLLFSVLWFTFSYLPMAHMVWYWDGPDAITSAATLEKVTAAAGFLWAKGALDFAGGTVVHINAGIAGLVIAIMLGKRIGYGKEPMAPHNLTLTLIGAAMLWVGWFGFNAGSALAADGRAGMAMAVTQIAAAAAALSWMFAEWLGKGKPSVLGIASGAVGGLVAITPAAGFVNPMGALIIGLVSGVVCFWGATSLKRMMGYDDSLDAFGVHGIGGIVGALLTGVFAVKAIGGDAASGLIEGNGGQVVIQLLGVGATVVYTAVASYIILKVIDMVIGLRVSEEEEREGLDVSLHGERVD